MHDVPVYTVLVLQAKVARVHEVSYLVDMKP